MKDSVVLLTKDAFHHGYLPVYGNKYWKTPNIDELARKGTVFTRAYTAAPSTIMSNMCFCTGKYPHESELSRYTFSGLHYLGDTFFDKANNLGFDCHIIWDEAWKSSFRVEDRYYCYGKNTTIHYLKELRQGVGAHYSHRGFLKRDDSKTLKVYETIEKEISRILNTQKKVFLWIHLPHVINGRTGYGQDVDCYDYIVGMLRKYFSDECIYISADHGNMNGEKGKVSYGHDVYEAAINIPLITPRINNQEYIDDLVVNIDYDSIILNGVIPERKLIYSDSAFFAQPNRKIALITQNYKYIYNKVKKIEELYDLRIDPKEECNLINDMIYDVDRHVSAPLRELFFYPYWDEIEDVRTYFRTELKKVWKTGTFKEEFIPTLKFQVQTHGYFQVIQLIDKLKKEK